MYICDFEIHAVPQEDIPGKCKPLLFILHLYMQREARYCAEAKGVPEPCSFDKSLARLSFALMYRENVTWLCWGLRSGS